ncbi:ash family protein [Escherichia coli]|uniref:ash family protein n=1 Tax=Escherichia coli TaxID=562 RepID=UPI00201D9120|nr:ash family protein [Escherichia coli]
MRFSEIAAVYFHALNKMLVSGTHTQWKLIDLQSDLFTVVFDSIVHELKHNKKVMFAQCVHSAIQLVDKLEFRRHTLHIVAKSTIGSETPELIEATNDAPASFLLSVLAHTRIMVGWAGEPKGSPVSLIAGSLNPVQSATSEIETSCGGYCHSPIKEAAIMATVPVSPYLKIEVVNGRAVIFSLYVACHFKRMHKNIVDRIEYLNCSREFFTRNFIPGTYRAYGDSVRGYYITLDGLMMLQLGLSLRTMRYYESCIEAFHEAETGLNYTASRRNQREVHS